MKQKPQIAITMGDAAGIGPEIIIRALARPEVHRRCSPLVVGDANWLRKAAVLVGVDCVVKPIQSLTERIGEPGVVPCLDLPVIPDDLVFGQLSAAAGHAAYLFLEKAVELALANDVHAICTAPLNKEALHLGGHEFPGHTEILAHLTGSTDYAMMLASPKLRVIHVTTHVGLVEAVHSLTKERIFRVIQLAHEIRKTDGRRARIAVCGVNPHAGEHGLFGCSEEELTIAPACCQAAEAGMDVTGPLPPDTVFFRAVRGEFDVVVAMYHDQGHIPVKLLGFEDGVNITVGLPIVRTSVDHGTAYDIAGSGLADATSLLAAIDEAVNLVSHNTLA